MRKCSARMIGIPARLDTVAIALLCILERTSGLKHCRWNRWCTVRVSQLNEASLMNQIRCALHVYWPPNWMKRHWHICGELSVRSTWNETSPAEPVMHRLGVRLDEPFCNVLWTIETREGDLRCRRGGNKHAVWVTWRDRGGALLGSGWRRRSSERTSGFRGRGEVNQAAIRILKDDSPTTKLTWLFPLELRPNGILV